MNCRPYIQVLHSETTCLSPTHKDMVQNLDINSLEILHKISFNRWSFRKKPFFYYFYGTHTTLCMYHFIPVFMVNFRKRGEFFIMNFSGTSGHLGYSPGIVQHAYVQGVEDTCNLCTALCALMYVLKNQHTSG
jgi:hypothetical protein